MAFVYRTYDASGNLLYSTDDSTYTLLATKTAPANKSKTFTGIPTNYNDRIVTRLMIDQVNGDTEAYVHTYSLNGGTLTATAPDSSNTSRTVFMIFGR